MPAKEDLLAATEALKVNTRAVLAVLPGKNHLLQDARTGGPNEYNEIKQTMSPSALELIIDWAVRSVPKS